MKNGIITGIAIVLAVFSLGFAGKTWWTLRENRKLTDSLNEELMKSDLARGKAETKFDDASKYIDDLESKIKETVDELNATVTKYGELKYRYHVLKTGKSESTISIVRRLNVKGDITPGSLYLARSESNLELLKSISGSYSDHRIDISATLVPLNGELPFEFEYNLHLKLAGQLVESTTESGAINYHISLKELDNDNNEVGELQLTQFNMVVDKPNSKSMYWWNPHLDIGALGLVGTEPLRFSAGGSLGLSTSGYGLTRNDLDWRFFRVSADIGQNSVALGFSPVLYNLGQLLPLVSNIWIGPHVNYSTQSEWKAGLFLGAML